MLWTHAAPKAGKRGCAPSSHSLFLKLPPSNASVYGGSGESGWKDVHTSGWIRRMLLGSCFNQWVGWFLRLLVPGRPSLDPWTGWPKRPFAASWELRLLALSAARLTSSSEARKHFGFSRVGARCAQTDFSTPGWPRWLRSRSLQRNISKKRATGRQWRKVSLCLFFLVSWFLFFPFSVFFIFVFFSPFSFSCFVWSGLFVFYRFLTFPVGVSKVALRGASGV